MRNQNMGTFKTYIDNDTYVGNGHVSIEAIHNRKAQVFYIQRILTINNQENL